MPSPDPLLAALPPDLAAWRPETQATIQAWGARLKQRHGAYALSEAGLPDPFPYQDLPPSAQLSYELVTWANVLTYLPLFAADPSPFVDARFKQRPLLEQYAAGLLTEWRYSYKHGARDWLVRCRADGQVAGVLHLYELSAEIIHGRPPHCCVGYALAAPFRRRGYGREALRHLLAQAAGLFGRSEVRALSASANRASQALLASCSFVLLEERPATRFGPAEQLWQRTLADVSADE